MEPYLRQQFDLLLQEATGCECWVKHENHTPTGAFKVRGGLNLMAALAAIVARDLDAAAREIAGSARSMGLQVTE